MAKPNIVVMKLLAGGHKKDTKVRSTGNEDFFFLLLLLLPIVCLGKFWTEGSGGTF